MVYYSKQVQNPELVEDLEIYPRLIQLGACLQTEIEAAGLDAILTMLPGEQVTLDYCGTNDCKSQAWVRLVSAGPYEAFPEAPEGPARCSLMIGYVIEVGFSHCAPMMSGASAPAPDAYLEAMRVQMTAMSAMLRAIRCCANADSDAPWSLGEYVPNGPDGGCLSGIWTVTVGDRREI